MIAKSFAYKLGINMSNPNDILAKLLSNQINTKTWSLKTPDLEMQTDGTVEDHSRAMEALALVFQNKHAIAKTDINTVVTSNQSWTLDQCIQDYRSERNNSVKPRTKPAWDTDFRQLILDCSYTHCKYRP